MRIISDNNGMFPNAAKLNFNRSANTQLQKVVNNINSRVSQNNRNQDVIEFSFKANKLLKSAEENSDKLIDYANSAMVGQRSQAEWAESALTQQRNGVFSVRNELQYQKDRLDTILSKISEYEKIAAGETPENGTYISQERAVELIDKYKQSIKNDFSAEIDKTVKFYNDWAKSYDKYSGGVASQLIGNVLESISSEALGLDKLSDDPAEISKALDDAIEKLDNVTKSIEDVFYNATGKEKQMQEFYTPESKADSEVWSKRKLEWEITGIETVTIHENTVFTGETLKIDDIHNLNKNAAAMEL